MGWIEDAGGLTNYNPIGYIDDVSSDYVPTEDEYDYDQQLNDIEPKQQEPDLASALSNATSDSELDNILNNYIQYKNQEIQRETGHPLEQLKESYNRVLYADELEKNKQYRKAEDSELIHNADGSLASDSDWMLKLKSGINLAVDVADWLFEASENIWNAGQGSWLDNAHINAIINGQEENMQNKDYSAAKETTLADHIEAFKNAEESPYAENEVYILKKFDGYDNLGIPKFLYKVGSTKVSAADRYKEAAIKGGWDIVAEKRFAGAKEWEKTFHALDEARKYRAIDEGSVVKDGKWVTRDEASGVGFGSGYTELYTKDLLGVDIGKTQEDYDRNLRVSKRIADYYKTHRISDSNFLDAIQARSLTFALGTVADGVADMLLPGNSTFFERWKDTEYVNKFVGYDDTASQQAAYESAKLFQDGKYVQGLWKAFQSPDALATTSVDMAGMALVDMLATATAGATFGASGIGAAAFNAWRGAAIAKKLIKMTKKFKKLESAGKDTLALQKEIKATERILKEISPESLESIHKIGKLSKYMRVRNAAITATVGSAGTTMFNIGATNDMLDARSANKIEMGLSPENSLSEITGAFLLNQGLLMLDRMNFGALVGQTPTIGQRLTNVTMRQTFDLATPVGKKALFGALVRKTAEVALDVGSEGAQEYIQQWGQIFSEQYGIGDADFDKITSDTQNRFEALQAGVIGAAVGGQLKTLRPASKIAFGGYKKAFNFLTEQKEDRIIKNAKSFDDLIQNGASIDSITDAVALEVANPSNNKFGGIDNEEGNIDTEKLHNRVASFVDSIADDNISLENRMKLEGVVYSEIFGKALKEAATQENEGRIEQIASAMKAIDDNENIGFDFNKFLENNNEKIAKEISIVIADNNPAHFLDTVPSIEAYNRSTDAEKKQYDKQVKEIKRQKLNNLYKQLEGNKVLAERVLGSDILQNKTALSEEDKNKIEQRIQSLDSTQKAIKLKHLIESFITNDFKLTYREVEQQIEDLGFVDIQKDSNGNTTIKFKPSISEFDSELTRAFMSPSSIETSMSDEATLDETKPSLNKLESFVESRYKKLLPYLYGLNKKAPSRRTMAHLFHMQLENAKLQKIHDKLSNMLSSSKASDEVKAQAREKLNNINESLRKTNHIVELYHKQMIDFVQNELGIIGFDPTNMEHAYAVSKLYVPLVDASDGNYKFGKVEYREPVWSRKKNKEQDKKQDKKQKKKQKYEIQNAVNEAIRKLILAGLERSPNVSNKIKINNETIYIDSEALDSITKEEKQEFQKAKETHVQDIDTINTNFEQQKNTVEFFIDKLKQKLLSDDGTDKKELKKTIYALQDILKSIDRQITSNSILVRKGNNAAKIQLIGAKRESHLLQNKMQSTVEEIPSEFMPNEEQSIKAEKKFIELDTLLTNLRLTIDTITELPKYNNTTVGDNVKNKLQELLNTINKQINSLDINENNINSFIKEFNEIKSALKDIDEEVQSSQAYKKEVEIKTLSVLNTIKHIEQFIAKIEKTKNEAQLFFGKDIFNNNIQSELNTAISNIDTLKQQLEEANSIEEIVSILDKINIQKNKIIEIQYNVYDEYNNKLSSPDTIKQLQEDVDTVKKEIEENNLFERLLYKEGQQSDTFSIVSFLRNVDRPQSTITNEEIHTLLLVLDKYNKEIKDINTKDLKLNNNVITALSNSHDLITKAQNILELNEEIENQEREQIQKEIYELLNILNRPSVTTQETFIEKYESLKKSIDKIDEIIEERQKEKHKQELLHNLDLLDNQLNKELLHYDSMPQLLKNTFDTLLQEIETQRDKIIKKDFSSIKINEIDKHIKQFMTDIDYSRTEALQREVVDILKNIQTLDLSVDNIQAALGSVNEILQKLQDNVTLSNSSIKTEVQNVIKYIQTENIKLQEELNKTKIPSHSKIKKFFNKLFQMFAKIINIKQDIEIRNNFIDALNELKSNNNVKTIIVNINRQIQANEEVKNKIQQTIDSFTKQYHQDMNEATYKMHKQFLSNKESENKYKSYEQLEALKSSSTSLLDMTIQDIQKQLNANQLVQIAKIFDPIKTDRDDGTNESVLDAIKQIDDILNEYDKMCK